jgi:hypothetical protein
MKVLSIHGDEHLRGSERSVPHSGGRCTQTSIFKNQPTVERMDMLLLNYNILLIPAICAPAKVLTIHTEMTLPPIAVKTSGDNRRREIRGRDHRNVICIVDSHLLQKKRDSTAENITRTSVLKI